MKCCCSSILSLEGLEVIGHHCDFFPGAATGGDDPLPLTDSAVRGVCLSVFLLSSSLLPPLLSSHFPLFPLCPPPPPVFALMLVSLVSTSAFHYPGSCRLSLSSPSPALTPPSPRFLAFSDSSQLFSLTRPLSSSRLFLVLLAAHLSFTFRRRPPLPTVLRPSRVL